MGIRGIKEIERAKGVVYRVRIERDGQKYDETFSRKFDALQFYEKIIKFGTALVATELTFAKAAEEWIKNHAEVYKAPSSIAIDKKMLTKHILPVLGQIKLRKVTPRQIEELIQLLKAKNLSRNTICRNLDPIKAIFNYYLRRQVIAFNPMVAISRFRPEQKAIEPWNRQDVSQFLAYTEQKYRGTDRYSVHLVYKMVLYSGLRVGEVLALPWSAVDFESSLITIGQSYCSVSKAIRKTTKSGKIRHVPLAGAIKGDLSKAYNQRTCDFVFNLNGRMIDKSNFRNRYFYKDMRESGVRRVRFHDLRHTFASHFMMNGGNLYTLQGILGHSDTRMTQRYSHLSKAHFASQADIIRYDDGEVIAVDFQRKNGTNV